MNRSVSLYRKFTNLTGPKVKSLLLLTIIVGIFWFAVETSFIYIFQSFLISLGLISHNNSMLPSWLPTDFPAAVTMLIIFGIVRSTALALKLHLSQVISQGFIRHQREKLLSYVFKYDNEPSVSEIVVFFNDIINQTSVVIMSVATITVTLSSAIFFLLFGLYIAPIEMLAGATLLAIGISPLRLLNQRFNEYGAKIFRATLATTTVLTSGIRNLLLLKIYNMREAESKKASRMLAEQEELHFKYSFYSAATSSLPLLLGILVISAVSILSYYKTHTSASVLVAFFYIFLRLAQSASEAKTTFDQMKLQLVGIDKLYDWTSEIDNKHYGSQPQKLSATESDILERTIEQDGIKINGSSLFFSYDSKNELFAGLSIQVESGKPLIIKGPSGSGKSTLLKVLLGLAKPQRGKILINNVDASIALPYISKHIGYVGPDPFLVMGSIRQNLMYGSHLSNVTDEQLMSAIETVGLTDLISSLPDCLDYLLKESAQLSTGQKQRLSIARALLRKPKLLILDEATANLDSASEAKIINAISSILKETTTVIVTHKNSFDKIGSSFLMLERKTVPVMEIGK